MTITARTLIEREGGAPGRAELSDVQTRHLTRLLALGAVAATLLVVGGGRVDSAEPSATSFSDAGVAAFEAGPFDVSNPADCASAPDTCDHIAIQVTVPGTLQITSEQPDTLRSWIEDHDLYLYDGDGQEVGSSAALGSAEELVAEVPAGTYDLTIQPYLVLPGSVLTGMIGFTPGDPDPGHDGDPFDDEVLTCLEATPAAVEPYVPVVGGDRIEISVAVLTDGFVGSVAEQFAAAATSYEPLGIDLVVESVGPIDLPSTGSHLDGDIERETADARAAIDQARRQVGGDRTSTGADIVYVLTDKDIYVGGSDDDPEDPNRSYGVVGLADCIGGVRFDHRSFAVSEVSPNLDEFNVFGTPVSMNHQVSPKTIAHEIGHLLGAHHHYANCIEGVLSETPTDEGNVEASPCTLMINVVDVASFNFSALNGPVSRGHASLRGDQRAGEGG